MTRMIHTLEMHARQRICETSPDSGIWIIKNSNGSRFVLTLGEPAQEAVGGTEQYWEGAKKAETRVSDVIGRVSSDSNCDRFMVHNTSNMIMLFSMPEWFWNCVRAVIMVGGIVVTTADGAFSVGSGLYAGQRYFDHVVKQAVNRFPIVHVDFAYSSGNNILSLHDLEGWRFSWPRVLHPDAYDGMLKKGIDNLFLNMIRLAAAVRDISAEQCASNAVAVFAKHGGGKPWMKEAARAESYPDAARNLTFVLPFAASIAAAADCPLNAPRTALAILLPACAPTMSVEELTAARVVWRANTVEVMGIDLALSGDSPQYILMAGSPAAGSKLDDAVKARWKTFLQEVKSRAKSNPRVDKAVAGVWHKFCQATKPVVTMLVADEKKRGGSGDRAGDMKRLQKNLEDGCITTICKRSLQ